MKRLLVHHLPPVVIVAIAANILGLLILAVFLISYFERERVERDSEQPYLSYLNLPFPTLESAVEIGQPVRLVVKRRNIDRQEHIYPVVASLVSDTDPRQPPIILSYNMAPIIPGDSEWISTINVIPINTPLGTYHIEGMAEVAGTHHSFNVPWTSQSFKVVGASY